jgi:hypothetical protein
VTIASPRRLAGSGTEPEALIKEARRRQHRRRAAGVAVAVMVAGTVTAALVAGSGGGSGSRVPGRHGASTAPAHAAGTLVTVSQTSLPGGNSLSLAVGYQAVWVTGVGVTYQVDEVTGRIVRTIRTPGTHADGCSSGIAAGAGAVWVTHDCQGIYRIDPRSGRVAASLQVPDVGGAVAVADGLLWVTDYHGDLLRIQPRTGQLVGQLIPVGFGGWTLIPAEGALWVTSYGSGVLGGTVSRVDLATGAVQRFGDFDVEAAGAGSLWTAQVQRINPVTGGVMASVPVSGVGAWGVPAASQAVFWNGSVWALSVQQSLTVLRIDPGTDRVVSEPVLVGSPFPAALAWTSNPTAFAAGPTGLWVLDFDRNLLFHLATKSAGLRAGQVLGA